MHPDESYIAIFDLDRTLININSGTVLVKRAYAKGLMSTKDLLHALYLAFLYKFSLRDTQKIIDGMAGWVKGIAEESMIKLSEEVFHRYLLDAIRPEIYTEIRFHKERTARIVILSSAIQYICSLVGRHLAVDDIICSELEVRDGLLTGRPVGPLCFGYEKLTRLKAYCGKMNCSPGKAYYYADDISDFHVLEAVGYPVCINPGRKLARAAAAKGWTIHQWH